MKQQQLRSHLAAIMLLAPAAATFVAQPVHAQRAVAPTSAIQSIALNADHGLSPGSILRFEVRALPDARSARVALGGSDVAVPLRQVAPGIYRGTHTVRRADRIDPTQLMTANLRWNDRTLKRSFSYPPAFQALAMGAAPAPAIERFVLRSPGRIEPGRELRFRLEGVPRGDAWVDIPGVISGVDLQETRPGFYEGSYTIRRRDDLSAFDRAVATLRSGNQRATARLAIERDVARDNRAPQVTDMLPAHGDRVSERGRTHISARLTDEGTGIDPESVRLRLDGRDVTADTRVDGNELQLRRELDPGRYTAEVRVADRAGNTTTKSWTFDVIDRERVGTLSPGVLPLEVTSHVNGGLVDNRDGTLTLQGRTAPFASVRVEVDTGDTSVLDVRLQADRNGVFSVPVTPSGFVAPGNRYDVRISATHNNQMAQERLTLRRQG